MDIYIDEFEKMYNSVSNMHFLRQKVLKLGVSGMLTSEVHFQNAVNFISERKEFIKEQIKDNKIRKPVPYDKNKRNDDFDIPKGWEWVRLGEISINKDADRVPLSVIDRENQEKLYDYYGATGAIDKVSNYIFSGKHLLIGEDGGNFYSKKDVAFLVNGDFWANNHVHVLDFPDGILHEYIAIYLNSVDLPKYEYINGIAVPKLNQKNLNSIMIPLMSTDEQIAIIERVTSILEDINLLEAKLKKKEHLLELLPQSVVKAIANSETEHQLKEQLEFLIENFESIFQTPESMQDLRNVILQLAIEGKLVQQDPTDEPASELLKKIKAEREQLVREKKIKKPSVLEPISEDEVPFEIPESWRLSKLGNLVEILGDGLHGTPEYTINGDYYFINGNNLTNGVVEIKDNTKLVSREEYEKYRKPLNENTVLVSINGTLGNIAFYNNENIVLGKSACFFNLMQPLKKHYLKIIIESNYFMRYAFTKSTGSTIKNLGLKAMNDFIIPVPPLNEQNRIIEKVNLLMAIVDQLEQKLTKKLEIIEMLGTA